MAEAFFSLSLSLFKEVSVNRQCVSVYGLQGGEVGRKAILKAMLEVRMEGGRKLR